MRFLSHRDTMRLWQRAFVRAQIPVCFSQGYNPHMILTLPLPRSVGMSSDFELLLLKLPHHFPSENFIRLTQSQLPLGIKLLALQDIPNRVSMTPRWARYQIALKGRLDDDQLSDSLRIFNEADGWEVKRAARGRHPGRTIDLKTTVSRMEYDDKNNNIFCEIRIDPSGTARMDELLSVLHLTEPGLVTEIRRLAVGYPIPIGKN